MSRSCLMLGLLLAALASTACGSSGKGSTGGVTTGGGSTSGLPFAGNVSLNADSSAAALGGEVIFTASASFATSFSSSTGGCFPSETTPCCFNSITGTTLPVGQTPASAGTITLTDGTLTLGTLTYRDDAGLADYAALSSLSSSGFGWVAGDVITISAAGSAGGVDAFSTTVTAPPGLTGISPGLSFTTALEVSISAPFTVAWTPVSDSSVQVLLSLTAASAATAATIDCVAPISAGTFTIPASMVGNLPSGGDGEVSLTPAVQQAPSTPPANAVALVQLLNSGAGGIIKTGP